MGAITTADRFLDLTKPQLARQVAYHEAGHAVVGMAVGMSLIEVWVNPDGREVGRSRTQRFVQYGRTEFDHSTAQCFDYAVKSMAGAAAETRHLHATGLLPHHERRTAPDEWDGAVQDLAVHGYRLVASGRAPSNGATWDQVMGAADSTVDRYWRQITAVAERLVVARQLTGDQVAHIARIPNPRPVKEA